ncbi:MAG: PepSY domain-containing protein [Cardiobacterium sp.]|jgi:peptidase propeptide and YPEB domain protein
MSKALLSVMSATFVAAFVFAISPAHADDDRDYYQQHRRQFISYEKAASIAARAVKGGVVTDLEFDHDRRGDHFDAEVRDASGHEYEIKIDARSGKVLSKQRDD